MFEFGEITLEAPVEWKFLEFNNFIIGKHGSKGLILQISTAFQDELSKSTEPKDAIAVLKEFAGLEELEEIFPEKYIENGVEVGGFKVPKESKSEHYFYGVSKDKITVAVLQHGQGTTEEINEVSSIIGTVQYTV